MTARTLLVAAALAACATPAPPPAPVVERPAPPTADVAPAAGPMRVESATPESAPLKLVLRGAPPAPAPPERAWPTANADSGESRLHLLAVFFAPQGPDEPPKLNVQGFVETDDPDLVLADAPSEELPRARLVVEGAPGEVVTRVVSADHFGAQDVSIVADVGADPRRVRSLDVELRLLRVRKWATREVRLADAAAHEGVEVGPYDFYFAGSTEWASIGAHRADRSYVRGPGGANRPIPVPFRPDGVIRRAEVVDARGVKLSGDASMGSGGAMATTFMNSGQPLAYPVTLKVRFPAEYDVVPVAYRFADLDVSSSQR